MSLARRPLVVKIQRVDRLILENRHRQHAEKSHLSVETVYITTSVYNTTCTLHKLSRELLPRPLIRLDLAQRRPA